ncbi:hypothetical protein [Rosistilla ulvae]|nr:hypothetical protein [Rosistilla ulvae]
MKVCIFLYGVLVVLCTGCSGDNNSGLVAVSGTVTIDGSPLPQGKIVLEPSTDAGERPFAGSINDGKFQIEASPGNKTVRITATRVESPAKISRKMQRVMESDVAGSMPVQYIPTHYNRDSDLTVEITAEGPNDLNWELKK